MEATRNLKNHLISCPNCGQSILTGNRFCGQCGHPLTVAKQVLPAVAKTKKGTRRTKILVIDDDPIFLETYLFKFDKEGFNVVLARSGEEGRVAALREKPAVILLDIIMPGMNGLEVLRRLKQDPLTQGIPVVLVTIVQEEEAERQGLALGAADYVSKDSMTPDVVVDRIRGAVERSKKGRGRSK